MGVFQSTHPVRGATNITYLKDIYQRKFQSTHPVRGATQASAELRREWIHFNPRTP